ncbi:NAD-dependent epimerase/dehydratase family protein [Sphingobium algorifonticola]|uniref:NAD-dependent epimerase/dehydratase family protein n=1 Tax=Sphingobium algorifonticola TaxID=2008318 RepID=A0A437JAB7_9SPHN|nr:NAD-dependent epimerase/dehydratase family protein [Sphingobium algorifonticola]
MTGATGFVGAVTLDLALKAKMKVHALTRQPQFPRKGVTWTPGALDDRDSLERLIADADAVLHIAGVVNAPDRAGFAAGNATGTMHVVDAMRRTGVRRIVHVSSLAAREPQLSAYGWSKELAERHVMASALDWTIVRPPAIYGPGDKEMLDLFRMANKGLVMLPPGGRLSVIEVSDLARLLLALVQERSESLAQIYEVDDGTPSGWSHVDFGQAIGRGLGRDTVRTLAAPRWMMNVAAVSDRMIRGRKAKLTQDRVAYFCHPDWVSRPELAPPARLWTPKVATGEGLAATAKAYREKGWL